MNSVNQGCDIDINTDITVRDARIMILDAGLKIKDVANEMGYSDTYFSKLFPAKNLTQMVDKRYSVQFINAINTLSRKNNK